MVTPAAGAVVLIPFPFSDLSQTRLRPALVLADAGRGDWIMCQITSNPYADSQVIALSSRSFQRGSLHRESFARPGKLFTAHQRLIAGQVGTLRVSALTQVIQAVVDVLRRGQ